MPTQILRTLFVNHDFHRRKIYLPYVHIIFTNDLNQDDSAINHRAKHRQLRAGRDLVAVGGKEHLHLKASRPEDLLRNVIANRGIITSKF